MFAVGACHAMRCLLGSSGAEESRDSKHLARAKWWHLFQGQTTGDDLDERVCFVAHLSLVVAAERALEAVDAKCIRHPGKPS
jgi:hypothetical protein